MAQPLLKAAIVGAGLMGAWHADASRRAGATIVGVADPDSRAAQQLGRRLGVAGVYDGLESLLEDAVVDVVHVCTPRDSHVEIVRRALRAGAHLLVEKPLAPTANETQSLLDEAAASELLLCPVHQFPFQRGVRRASRWLRVMHAVSHMEVTVCTAGAEGADEAESERILEDVMPHPLSLVQSLLHPQLDTIHWRLEHTSPAQLSAHGTCHGASLHILVSLTARPTQCAARLFTSSGTIHLDLFHGYAFREDGRVSRARKITRPFALASRRLFSAGTNMVGRICRRESAYPGLRELIGAFYDSVRQGTAPPISPHATIATAQARDAIISAVPRHGHRA